MDFYKKPDEEQRYFWLDLAIIIFIVVPILAMATTLARCLGLP